MISTLFKIRLRAVRAAVAVNRKNNIVRR